jgi:hypothetical protein
VISQLLKLNSKGEYMSEKAMKLALCHLINLQPILGNGLLEERQLAFIDPHIDCAITALQEGLAEQPAQQQQEPVAVADGTFNHNCPVGTPLYTSPPAQRTWVGLTKEERDELWYRLGYMDLMIAIEEKLREKNT